MIRVHDSDGNVIEAQKHAARAQESCNCSSRGMSRFRAEINSHGIHFIGYYARKEAIEPSATLMRQLSIILTMLAVAAFQTRAGNFEWLFDVAKNDEIARKQAQFLVWDGVPHPLSASFEKVNMIDKHWPFYLFHVVVTGPRNEVDRHRSSYLVCFRLNQHTTEFRIVTAIQYASDPPTESEITIDKRLNGWPVSPPWKAGDDLPYTINGSGLNIVLDKSRAGLDW
jgi:hypothetical protein